MFLKVVDVVGTSIDAAGVTVIAADRLRRRVPDTYRRYRQQLGRSILLGLEMLVAADIIRTVAVAPTVTSVSLLAGIVLIRTFLSFSLELEITGRWPWQKPDPTAGTRTRDATTHGRKVAVDLDHGRRGLARGSDAISRC